MPGRWRCKSAPACPINLSVTDRIVSSLKFRFVRRVLQVFLFWKALQDSRELPPIAVADFPRQRLQTPQSVSHDSSLPTICRIQLLRASSSFRGTHTLPDPRKFSRRLRASRESDAAL